MPKLYASGMDFHKRGLQLCFWGFELWRGARKLPISANGAFSLFNGPFSDLNGPFPESLKGRFPF